MDTILIIDQVKRLMTAVAYGDLTNGIKAELAFEEAQSRIKKLKNLMRSNLPNIEPLNWEALGKSKIKTKSNFSKTNFEEAVKVTKNHISNGLK